jgi:hypothetical protein
VRAWGGGGCAAVDRGGLDLELQYNITNIYI